MAIGMLIGVIIESLVILAVCSIMIRSEHKDLKDGKSTTAGAVGILVFGCLWIAWRSFLTAVCMGQYFNWR